MRQANSLEKSLMLEGLKKGGETGPQRMGCLDGTTDSVHMNLSKLREMVKDREVWHAVVHRGCKESDMTD